MTVNIQSNPLTERPPSPEMNRDTNQNTTQQQPAPTITPLMGALGPEIIAIVHGFDFSKIDLRSTSTHSHLFTGLAPSSAQLTREVVSTMDESVKIMMAVCTKLLAAIPAEDRTWHTVRAAMMQNPVTEPVEAYSWKPEPLYRRVTVVARPDIIQKPITKQKIEDWVECFPDDILWESGIDSYVVAAIVNSVEAVVTPTVYMPGEIYDYSKPMVDITVLRYPDTEYPYFKLYRIYLKGMMYSKREAHTRTDGHGIMGRYECHIFRPCTAVTDQLDENAKQQCIEMAETLFEAGAFSEYNFTPEIAGAIEKEGFP